MVLRSHHAIYSHQQELTPTSMTELRASAAVTFHIVLASHSPLHVACQASTIASSDRRAIVLLPEPRAGAGEQLSLSHLWIPFFQQSRFGIQRPLCIDPIEGLANGEDHMHQGQIPLPLRERTRDVQLTWRMSSSMQHDGRASVRCVGTEAPGTSERSAYPWWAG